MRAKKTRRLFKRTSCKNARGEKRFVARSLKWKWNVNTVRCRLAGVFFLRLDILWERCRIRRMILRRNCATACIVQIQLEGFIWRTRATADVPRVVEFNYQNTRNRARLKLNLNVSRSHYLRVMELPWWGVSPKESRFLVRFFYSSCIFSSRIEFAIIEYDTSGVQCRLIEGVDEWWKFISSVLSRISLENRKRIISLKYVR